MHELLVESGCLCSGAASGAGAPEAVRRLRLRRRRAAWQPQTFTAIIIQGSGPDEFTFAPAAPPKPKRTPRRPADAGAAGDGALAPIAAPGGGDDDAPGDLGAGGGGGAGAELDLDAAMADFLDELGVDGFDGDVEEEVAEAVLGAEGAEHPEERLLDECGVGDAADDAVPDDGGGEGPDGVAGGLFVDGYVAPDMEDVRRASRGSRRAFELASKTANVQAPSTHPMKHGVISLIEADGRVMFVRWDTVPGEGRQIHLDAQQRVKTLIFYAAPVLKPLGGPHRVLARDTGVAMVKTTGGTKERPPMTEWALVLKYHAEVQAHCGPRLPNDVKGNCALCDGHLKEAFKLPPMGDLFVCTICLVPWHRCCAQACDADVTFEPFQCDMCTRLGM